MRIALITDAWRPQVNGVVTTLSHVCEELTRGGDEMLVIHPGDFRTIPCPRYAEIRLSILPSHGVARLLDEFRPEAIHVATEGPLGLAARRYCRRRGVPFTTSYHTQFARYLRVYFKVPERLTWPLLRWFHNGAERTLAPTAGITEELKSHGFRGARTWTRGVDTGLFQPREKTFLHHSRPIFVYVGRVAHEKNVEAFLACDLPGTKLVVGDGPAMASLRRKYPAVVFAGFRHGEDLARHVAACDVFVFPSRTDTFGVVMLEAMASGLPVAAYPVTGPIDVVRHGASGVLDDDLARAARRALELDPVTCREYALQFSWQRCAAMFRQNLAPIVAAAGGDGLRAEEYRRNQATI